MPIREISYHRPQTLMEACELGRTFGGEGRFMAGGTELIVDLDKNDVDFAIVQARPGHVSNDLVAEAVRRHPNRMVALARVGSVDAPENPVTLSRLDLTLYCVPWRIGLGVWSEAGRGVIYEDHENGNLLLWTAGSSERPKLWPLPD